MLVVEDQMIVAMEIEDLLRELACDVVGPVNNLKTAVRLARDEVLDAAVLDVNLDGEKVFAAAEELQTRAIPFILSTGYGEAALPERWRGQPRLGKPFNRDDLAKFVRSIARRRPEESPPLDTAAGR